MTQEVLADRAGVGVRTIRGLETGERADPRVDTVRRLATALALQPQEQEELLRAAVRRPTAEDQHNAFAGQTSAEIGPPDTALPGTEAQGASGRGVQGKIRFRVASNALADAAEQFARAVASRWTHEEEQRQVQDPYPMPVRWRMGSQSLTDHQANILRLRWPAEDKPGLLDLTGQLDEIVAVYRRIPSGRLVVLGRSGSGKTVLAVRFVLDQLNSRGRDEAVPVLLGISSWNPTTITLRDWLARRLTLDYPGLAAARRGGSSLAAEMVDTGWILPVLDGFDEIAEGLRRPALEALNTTTLPLLLTSRPDEYAAAVAETDVLTAAASVEIVDLTLVDLAEYLPRTTRRSSRMDPAGNAWDSVLAELRERPHSRASANLTAMLSTPLMVALARTVYSDDPANDPADLLDTQRFGGAEELEEHLLASLVPTVYRPRPEQREPGAAPHPDIDPEHAQYWLGYLAHHLTLLRTPDLAWWRLGGSLRRSTRTLVTAGMTGLVVGLMEFLADTFSNPFEARLADGTAVGLMAGLMFGLGHWLTGAVKDTAVPPTALRLRLGGRKAKPHWRIVPRLVTGSLCGLVFGSGYGVALGVMSFAWHPNLSADVRIGLVDGLLLGLLFSAAAGLAFGLLGLLEAPLDVGAAVNPPGLLRENRKTVAAQLFVIAPTFGLLVGFGSGPLISSLQGLLGPLVWNTAAGYRIGALSSLGGTLGYALTLTAWGQWTVFARIWLPLTGRLPWSPAAFMEDAYRRGVLRQAGAVYQFRHARLQHHLARTYRISQGSPQTTRKLTQHEL